MDISFSIKSVFKVKKIKIIRWNVSLFVDLQLWFRIHDIKINYTGPYASVDLHIEVDSKLSLIKAHEISTKVEKQSSTK